MLHALLCVFVQGRGRSEGLGDVRENIFLCVPISLLLTNGSSWTCASSLVTASLNRERGHVRRQGMGQHLAQVIHAGCHTLLPPNMPPALFILPPSRCHQWLCTILENLLQCQKACSIVGTLYNDGTHQYDWAIKQILNSLISH